MVVLQRRFIVVQDSFSRHASNFKSIGESSMSNIMTKSTENISEYIFTIQNVEVWGQRTEQITTVHD